MARYTVRLGEPSGSKAQLAGGKGANLSALVEAGFPVPDAFVVTTTAYRDFVDAAGLRGAEPDLLREQIPRAEIPDPITAAILAGYAELGAPAVAVRSSGTAEDLAGASFAGQHDTYLGISGPDAVLAAVRNCWASLWTVRAVAYRRRYGWDEAGLALAVVIQTMVDAELAGVLFTADPVSGRRDRIVAESVRGLGEALVSGQATGEQYVIDKATSSVLRRGRDLPEGGLRELIELGLKVEERFGGPQDIEWTYAGGRFALVQARPLTALPDEPPDAAPDEGSERPARARRRRYRRNFSMAVDHMPYPPFPMDVTLLIRPALRTILAAVRSAGFDTPALTDVLVEIDDGVVQIVPPRVRPTRRVLLGVPAALPKVVRLLRTRTDDWREKSEATLLRRARHVDAEDLTQLGDAALLARVESLLHTAGVLMPSRFGAIPAGAAAEQIGGRLLRRTVGPVRADVLHADLMSAIPCVTTEANAELSRIAEIVRNTPELREVYRTEEPTTVATRLATSSAGRHLLAEIDAYLRAFGFRELSIFTVGLPPLRERPDVVHRLIAGRVHAPDRNGSDRDEPDRFRSARSALAAETGPLARITRPVIVKMFDAARNSVGFREDSHYQLTMMLAVARRVLLELGARMVARGALDDPNDIAYLTPAEIDDLSPDEARQTVARRKAGRAAALDHYTIVPAEFLTTGDGHQLRGTPASRGSVVGPVRVVHDDSEFDTLRAGEVLVCPYTNPTWTPLFALAAAVVVDAGGAASHAAIVAREHGIPAVMGTGNGTRVLVDGQRVLVDADHGTVTPITGAATDRSEFRRASADTSPASSRGR